MKILLANDLYGPSSAAGVAVNTARTLSARGHEVHFAATVQSKDEVRTFDEPSGVRVHLFYARPYDLRFRSWVSLYNPRALRGLKRVLDDVQPDVVHFHNVHIFLSYRALKVASATGSRVVFSAHDVMPFCFQKMFCFVSPDLQPDGPPISFKAPMPRCIPCARFRYNPLRNPWIRHHLRHYTDRILAVSSEMGRALRENRIAGVGVLANGIDPASVADVEEGAAFRKEHGLEGRKVVLYGGRLDHRKGADHLLQALVKVRTRVPEAALLVVGSGHSGYEDSMLNRAQELGLEDHLVVTGWIDQESMGKAYEAADVICTPSLIFESFGLINAEGMLRGKPAITSFFGGPRDVVEDGVSGFLVNPLQVDRMAERLTLLLEDDELRAKMGEEARKRVLEHFNLEVQAVRLEEIYSELLGED